jgi:hypothetical protein
MRTDNLVVTAMLLVGAAACSSSSDTVIGMRADGVKVACTPQGEDVSACTPVDPAQCDSAATVLWPPNHKMVQFTLAECIAVQTGCGGGGGDGGGSGSGSGGGSGSGSGSGSNDGVLLRTTHGAALAALHLTSITVDEAVEVGAGGDGHTTTTDVHITDAVTFELRSERQGGGDGRVYRASYVDDAGVAGSCEFVVPHDQGPTRGAVDSGVVVTVTP